MSFHSWELFCFALGVWGLYKSRVRPRHETLGTVGGFGAILLWSMVFAFARSLSEQVGPITAAAVAYLAGSALLFGRLAFSPGGWRRALRLPRDYALGCGALFVVYTTAIYLAVGLAQDRLQLLEIALVNYLWPSLTVLFSIGILGQRASFWLFPGTVLALAGVFLVMTQGEHVSWAAMCQHVRSNPRAYGLALIAAVSWALYSNWARRWADPQGDGGVEWFLLATGLALLGLRALVTEPAAWNLRAGFEVCGLACITAVAYLLWDLAMRRGRVLVVVVASYFTPLLSTLVSSLYLEVAPGPNLWVGCILLICGSFITWRSVSERSDRNA